MSRFQFGTGVCYVKPNAGDLVVNPTPRQLGTMQDCQIEFAGSIKELKGMNLFPEDLALATMKITGKAKLGQIDIALFNDTMFSEPITLGATTDNAYNEVHAIPATPFQVTIVPPGSGVYSEDHGCKIQETGEQMTRVTGTPAAGQYSVVETTGVYTFSSADNVSGYHAMISYDYTLAASGSNYIVNNHVQGYGPSYELLLRGYYETKFCLLRLFACKSEKITIPSKQGDYWISEMDFQAYANSGGQVAQFYQS